MKTFSHQLLKLLLLTFFTAILGLALFTCVGCRSTKNVTRAIEKAMHQEKVDSSFHGTSTVTVEKKDSSKYDTEITVDFDSVKSSPIPGWSSFAMPDPSTKNHEILVSIGGSVIHASQPVKSITIKTDGQLDTKEIMTAKKSDTGNLSKDTQVSTVQDHYNKQVVHNGLSWKFWLIAILILAVAAYIAYRKYKSNILKWFTH